MYRYTINHIHVHVWDWVRSQQLMPHPYILHEQPCVNMTLAYVMCLYDHGQSKFYNGLCVLTHVQMSYSCYAVTWTQTYFFFHLLNISFSFELRGPFLLLFRRTQPGITCSIMIEPVLKKWFFLCLPLRLSSDRVNTLPSSDRPASRLLRICYEKKKRKYICHFAIHGIHKTCKQCKRQSNTNTSLFLNQ